MQNNICNDSGKNKNTDGSSQKKQFLVEEKQLLLLFGRCKHPECVSEIADPVIKACGFAVNVTIKCCFGHVFTWNTQPMLGRVYAANL